MENVVIFSRGHATPCRVGRSVRRSVCRFSNIFGLGAVFSLLPLPIRPRLDCRVSGLVLFVLVEPGKSDCFHPCCNSSDLAHNVSRGFPFLGIVRNMSVRSSSLSVSVFFFFFFFFLWCAISILLERVGGVRFTGSCFGALVKWFISFSSSLFSLLDCW